MQVDKLSVRHESNLQDDFLHAQATVAGNQELSGTFSTARTDFEPFVTVPRRSWAFEAVLKVFGNSLIWWLDLELGISNRRRSDDVIAFFSFSKMVRRTIFRIANS